MTELLNPTNFDPLRALVDREPFQGVYMFVADRPVWVGISKDLRRRFENHVCMSFRRYYYCECQQRPTNPQSKSGLAVAMAKEMTGYQGRDLKDVRHEPGFVGAFRAALYQIRENMSFSFIEEAGPLRCQILEFYCYKVLSIPHGNDHFARRSS